MYIFYYDVSHSEDWSSCHFHLSPSMYRGTLELRVSLFLFWMMPWVMTKIRKFNCVRYWITSKGLYLSDMSTKTFLSQKAFKRRVHAGIPFLLSCIVIILIYKCYRQTTPYSDLMHLRYIFLFFRKNLPSFRYCRQVLGDHILPLPLSTLEMLLTRQWVLFLFGLWLQPKVSCNMHPWIMWSR